MGGLFKEKERVTNNPMPALSMQQKRLLFVDGDKGSVATRIYGDPTKTFPRFSEQKRIEMATRSLARLKNLSAVRGEPEASMVGPADYFGNLETPSEKLYTVRIDNDGIPMVYHQSLGSYTDDSIKEEIAPENIVSVAATWTSGIDPTITEKTAKYEKKFGESLFPNPGLLEIEAAELHFKPFDATHADLSSFKARLVANDKPFRITEKPLPASDEYRAVSFLYEPEYGPSQVKSGGGLFLETHCFAQTITPLDKHAKGFVTLGRWADDTKTKLELISIEIPYGYTLIIEEDSIHGDATLDGMFMMCMTSNHKTMQTADSVFLKSTVTKDNINLVMDGTMLPPPDKSANLAPRPLVMYNCRDDVSDFLKQTKGENFIFNPFSQGFWKRAVGLINEWQISQEVLGAFVAVVGVAAVVVAFGVLNAVTFGIPGLCLAGAGVVAAVVGLGIFADAKLKACAESAEYRPVLA